MTAVLTKKDYKIIWISSKNPEKLIIELDKDTLRNLIWTKKRAHHVNNSLLNYIKSWEINNPANISGSYTSMQDLISDLHKLW